MIEIKDIGQLDMLITLKNYSQTVLGNGERKDTWATYGTVWAAMEFAGASETVSDDMALPSNRVNFYVRYDSSINEKCRVSLDSKEYAINGIQQIGRNEFMILNCETITLV